MSINVVPEMLEHCGKTLTSFGLDQTKSITYTFNHQGFRSNTDFKSVPDYAFFGCSLVLGIGVPIGDTFASQFTNSQNYGVAGTYTNADIFENIKNFINSPLYQPTTCMAVFWTDRDPEMLDSYYHELNNISLIHFFCGTPLPYTNCYSMVPNIDYDVSNTHIGPTTHKFIYKILCALFNQS